MRWKAVVHAALFLTAAFGQLAQAQVRPPATPPASAPAGPAVSAVDSSYVLGPGDVVDIGLVGRGDFSGRARVGSDGTILLPLIGSIKAADRTVIELGDDVRQALIKGGFYADPVVRAEVIGISSRYVTVLGNVGSPWLVPLDRSYRLSEILARVGGRSGAGADYVVLTPAGGATPERHWISKLAAGGPEADPLVRSGDKIYIPAADNEMFYISGQVNSPGGYPVTEGLTMRMAIAKGGGVNENGSEKKLKVVRNGQTLKRVKLEDPVTPGDVITIGERLF
jgi:polysaccharide biosynthesis/export protein